jgi:hypothetical protein
VRYPESFGMDVWTYWSWSFLLSKALKVVELKEILSKAQVSISGKANKPDLIARILASPEALKVYEQQHGSSLAQNASKPTAPVSTKPLSSVAVSLRISLRCILLTRSNSL